MEIHASWGVVTVGSTLQVHVWLPPYVSIIRARSPTSTRWPGRSTETSSCVAAFGSPPTRRNGRDSPSLSSLQEAWPVRTIASKLHVAPSLTHAADSRPSTFASPGGTQALWLDWSTASARIRSSCLTALEETRSPATSL